MLSDEAQLRTLIRSCDIFLEQAGPNATLALLEAFLLVCLYEGAGLKELCDLSGQAPSTLSRHLLDLGDFKLRTKQPGLKLVAWRHPPEELRRKEYHLTAKGRALRDRLMGIGQLPEVHMAVAADYQPATVGYRSRTGPRKRRSRLPVSRR